jgi:hypothetical protein
MAERSSAAWTGSTSDCRSDRASLPANSPEQDSDSDGAAQGRVVPRLRSVSTMLQRCRIDRTAASSGARTASAAAAAAAAAAAGPAAKMHSLAPTCTAAACPNRCQKLAVRTVWRERSHASRLTN